MKPQEIFAKRLKELREEHSFTQEQLAAKVDTTKQAMSRYEKNQREPGINVVTKIAAIFDVSVDYMLGRSDKK